MTVKRVPRVKMRFLMAAAAILLLGGCAGDAYFGPFDGPYLGGFGPYYSGGWYHGGDFVDRGAHYHNYYGGHHFAGHTLAAHHFGHAFGGSHGGGFHGGGGHGGGGHR